MIRSVLFSTIVIWHWFLAAADISAETKPNFVVILVDDVGYADVPVLRSQGFQTPNLDRMATEGTRLTDFCVHPVCGVTRAALMTGCYAMRVAEVANTLAVIGSLSFRYADVTGVGKEPGVCRRDPSDVIEVGDTAYVYYTKVVKDKLPDTWERLYPSGYPGTIWYATSKDDGRSWEERGEAIGLGESGAFDSFGVFTPNILACDGKYYLYYTAVQPTPGRGGGFDNNSTNDSTAIGVAVADAPFGPFVRVANNPVLTGGKKREAFDSYRVDDACLLVRGKQVWLYYKGRSITHGRGGPARTRMGVAVSDHPSGPFVKQNGGKSVQDSGHEVQVFVYGKGVMSLVSPTGPNGRTLQYSEDGLNFRALLRGLADMPKAPGLYRPELTDATVPAPLPEWGLAMGAYGGDPYLVRYECVWNAPDK